jgi:predicted porin
MRNTKIALAVLALVASTAAMAEGVTIYGTIDAGYMSSNAAGARNGVTGLDSGGAFRLANSTDSGLKQSNSSVESGLISPNFLGFKASEDLEGGMKADVHVQTAYNAVAGGSFAFTQTDVGLSGDFGTVRLGKTVDPMWAQGIAGFDAAGGSNIGSAVGPAIDMGITAVFPNNTMTYLSPNIGGFSAAAQYRNAQKPGANTSTNNNVGNGYSLTANYAMGPVSVGAGMSENKLELGDDTTTTALSGNSNAKIKGTFLGAGYDMGVAKVNVLYLKSDAEGNPTATTINANADAWGVNGSVPMGQIRLVAGYYSAKSKNDNVEDGKATMYHLTGFYDLSKRTSLFANYQNVNNDSKYGQGGMLFALSQGSSVARYTIGSANAFTVGVRHTF